MRGVAWVASASLAQAGAKVYASDISEKMVGEAQDKAEAVLGNINPTLPCRI